MILHPDGRVEGTPEELDRYQELKAGQPETNRIIIREVVPTRSAPPEPYIAPGTPPWLVPTYPSWQPGQFTTTGDPWPVDTRKVWCLSSVNAN